jgi:tetratricopeptide (TPR) repeat protein
MPFANKTFQQACKALSDGRFSEAIDLFCQLIDSDPDNLSYLSQRGEAYLRSELYEAALVDYAKVVEMESNNVIALVNFGAALIRCNQQENAKQILEYALDLDPSNYDALINLCNVHQALRKPEDALRTAFRAIELRPTAALAHNNLGTALGDLNFVEDSRQAFITANTLDPLFLPAAINLAQVEAKLGNHSEASRLYERILTFGHITPNETELVKYYLGYAYLNQGLLDKGWDHYEYGFGELLPWGARRSSRRFNQPRWQGENLSGKTLMVWREQGLGDEIEFSTCLHDLSNLDTKVIIETDPRLISIFHRQYPNFIIRPEHTRDDFFPIANDFDVQIPIGSLPRIFRRNMADFERMRSNWIAQDIRSGDFRKRLAHFKKKKVGICWRSAMLSVARNDNYTALPDWYELLAESDFQFVNLQYGDCEQELKDAEHSLDISILRWPDLDLKNDLEGVVALINELDCVVTVGTAVSSLAGAVGKKTYLLTQKSWMMLGEDNRYPWYRCVYPLIPRPGSHISTRLKDVPQLLRSE